MTKQKISVLHPLNCAVVILRKVTSKEKKVMHTSTLFFSNFYFLLTFIPGDLYMFAVFHGTDVCDAGDFICLADERERERERNPVQAKGSRSVMKS